MFYHRCHQFAIADRRPEHLRDRMFCKHALLLTLHRQTDVDATALGSRDLHTETVLRQINLPRVGGVKLNRRR